MQETEQEIKQKEMFQKEELSADVITTYDKAIHCGNCTFAFLTSILNYSL